MRYEIKSPTFREGEPSVVVRMIVIPDERVAFSKGGLAQHAKAVAAAGRYGDDMFVHMNRDEFELLKSMWGEPTYHPETGMPEYFSLKSLIPIIGAALMFTGVGSGLGATLLGSGASSMAAGALGNGIIGALTSAASGGNGRDVLRGGLLGGAGGALSGYFSGAGAAAKGTSMVAPEGTALTQTAGPASAFGSKLGLAGDAGKLAADTSISAAPTASTSLGGMQFGDFAPMNAAAGASGAAGAAGAAEAASAAGAAPALTGALSSAAPAAANAAQSTGALSKILGSAGSGAAGASGSGMNGLVQAGLSYAKQHPYISAMLASSLFGPSENGQQGAPMQPTDPNFAMHLPQFTFNRTRNSASGPVTYTYGEQANNQPFYLDNSLAAMVPQVPPVGMASGGRIDVNGDTLAGMGIDPQYLMDHKFVPTRAGIRTLHQDQNGYYTVPDQLTWSADGKPVPASLADQQLVTLPAPTYVPTTPVVSGGTSQAQGPQLGNDYNSNQYTIPTPGSVFRSRYGNYKLPGLAHGGSAVAGHVSGPGTGRTDEIPARLSDGEYVWDSESVALLGDGSTKEGARRLDQMRETLRKHKGRNLVKGKISADAPSAEKLLGSVT